LGGKKTTKRKRETSKRNQTEKNPKNQLKKKPRPKRRGRETGLEFLAKASCVS